MPLTGARVRRVLDIMARLVTLLLLCCVACGRSSVGGLRAASDGETGAPPLSTDGVVVRYFLDEAASGQSPARVLDGGPFGFDIDLTYAGARQPEYVELSTGRGLYWDVAGDAGGPVAAYPNPAIETLHGTTAATYEAVIDFIEATNQTSRIIHVGHGFYWDLSIGFAGSVDDAGFPIGFFSGGLGDSEWSSDLRTRGRSVVHMVWDSTRPSAADRQRYYLDGVLQAATTSTAPGLGQTVDLSESDHFAIGQRQSTRSPRGSIYYAAIYRRALSDAEIGAHVARLAASDDP